MIPVKVIKKILKDINKQEESFRPVDFEKLFNDKKFNELKDKLGKNAIKNLCNKKALEMAVESAIGALMDGFSSENIAVNRLQSSIIQKLIILAHTAIENQKNKMIHNEKSGQEIKNINDLELKKEIRNLLLEHLTNEEIATILEGQLNLSNSENFRTNFKKILDDIDRQKNTTLKKSQDIKSSLIDIMQNRLNHVQILTQAPTPVKYQEGKFVPQVGDAPSTDTENLTTTLNQKIETLADNTNFFQKVFVFASRVVRSAINNPIATTLALTCALATSFGLINSNTIFEKVVPFFGATAGIIAGDVIMKTTIGIIALGTVGFGVGYVLDKLVQKCTGKTLSSIIKKAFKGSSQKKEDKNINKNQKSTPAPPQKKEVKTEKIQDDNDKSYNIDIRKTKINLKEKEEKVVQNNTDRSENINDKAKII